MKVHEAVICRQMIVTSIYPNCQEYFVILCIKFNEIITYLWTL